MELVLGHGMREPGAPSLGVAVMRFLHTLITPTFTYAVLFRNVKDLVSQKDFGPGVSGSIWRMVREAFKTKGLVPFTKVVKVRKITSF